MGRGCHRCLRMSPVLGYGRGVSTPPFVDLPAGAVVEYWQVRGSQRAVMHVGLEHSPHWAVLVPGFTGSKEDFIAVLPLLADAGIGALAFDQLGQYQSAGSDVPADYDVDLLAADLAEVVVEAARRSGTADGPHLVGHSFGGLVAQAAVVSGRVRPASLTLLCTGPGALPEARWEGLPSLVDALDEHDLATIWRIMREMEQAEDVVPPAPPVAAFLEDRWHANHPVQLREVAQHLMREPDRSAALARVVAAGLPTTVMWGEQDDAWPVEGQQVLADRIGARAVELPGLGHSPNAQDAPALVRALLAAWGA
jgi:pimeloyl-ACP methyl ester carboxylesterase